MYLLLVAVCSVLALAPVPLAEGDESVSKVMFLKSRAKSRDSADFVVGHYSGESELASLRGREGEAVRGQGGGGGGCEGAGRRRRRL